MNLFKLTLIVILSLMLTNCTNNDDKLKARANELAQKFIITDGHIDLPWRLHKMVMRMFL